MRAVVAGFYLFNGQIIQQATGVEKLDRVVVDFYGGVVGTLIVAVDDHVDDNFA